MRAVLPLARSWYVQCAKIIDKIIPRVLDIFRLPYLGSQVMPFSRFLGKFANSFYGLRHITALDTHNATFPRGKIMPESLRILLRLPCSE